MFLAALNQTFAATAMPAIVAVLGGFERYTWKTAAYLVISAVIIPVTDRLSDINGRQMSLVLALTLFTVFSILAGVSEPMNQLVAARAMQGFGVGMITDSYFTAGADLFPSHRPANFQALARISQARRPVQVARFRDDETVIASGLKEGNRLVVSVLRAPVAGMKLRVLQTGSHSTNGDVGIERPTHDGRNERTADTAKRGTACGIPCQGPYS